MTGDRWTAAMHALICVRIGQELGTDCDLTRRIAALIDAAIEFASRFFV